VRALWQDIRYALVSLRRTPTFTIAVVVTLALTIGPTTAILSVGNWLLWRPAPHVVRSDQLAVVWFAEWPDSGGFRIRQLSDLIVADLRQASRTFSDIAGWEEYSASVAAEGLSPRRAESAHVDVSFFSLLGVRPVAGRDFRAEDNRPPFGSPVVMLSERLAVDLYGEPALAVDQSVTVNGRRMAVVGVMPRGFEGPRPFSRVDVWFPAWTYYHVQHFNEASMRLRAARGMGTFYTFVIRLRPDATFDAAEAELNVLVRSLARQDSDDNEALRAVEARVYPGLGPHELQRDRYSTLVRTLLIVGGLLLLLGSANVTNLMISRGIRRQHDRAIRLALGATRARLGQMVLIESSVLAGLGAVLGVGLAVWLKQLIQVLLLPPTASVGGEFDVPLDVRVLAATLAISLACGVAAGLVPAWLATRPTAGGLVRSNVRVLPSGRRLRLGLAAAQLAVSLALATNAVLLVGTLYNLAAIHVGFNPQDLTVHFVDLQSHGYTPERATVFDRELLDRLSADQAFESASLSFRPPPRPVVPAELFDPRSDEQARVNVMQEYVTDGYFRTLAQPLIRGREFTRTEAMTTSRQGDSPVVLGESLARRLFGDLNAVGRQVTVPASQSWPEQTFAIVGVVGDIRSADSVLANQTDLVMYVPFSSGRILVSIRPAVMVRSGLPLREVGERVLAHASAIDPSLAVQPPVPLTAVVAGPLSERRALAWVLALLGGLGFVLSAVGVHGVLAQMVSERTREFGIRMAVGAERRRILAIVLKQAAWIAILGCASGLGLAVAGSRLVESQLFGVSRFQPSVYVASAVGLVAVVLIASAWTARVATLVEPVEALREE
jgi:predicted permease